MILPQGKVRTIISSPVFARLGLLLVLRKDQCPRERARLYHNFFHFIRAERQHNSDHKVKSAHRRSVDFPELRRP